MNYLEHMKERVTSHLETAILTEDMMWQHHEHLVWKAEEFDGSPTFYPVYRYKNFYSYSILALILKKGSLIVSPEAVRNASKNDFEVLDNECQIDKEINRVGGCHSFGCEIRDEDSYCKEIAKALRRDIAQAETNHPGYTNLVMCGGKDSMNLLLLPWKNPVIALSAEPNYPLVCEFVRQNELDIEVQLLEDHIDENYLDEEIAELCCRMDGNHWRWTKHLNEISEHYSKRVIIWKGQLGDLYMTSDWMIFMRPHFQPKFFFCRVFKKIAPFLPVSWAGFIGHYILPGFVRALWMKSSIAQGCHNGFIRSLTDTLVLSAYHGKSVTDVIKNSDLPRVVRRDVRPKIGRLLLGRSVLYPKTNPSPALSTVRTGAHRPEHLIKISKDHGIKIV